MPLPLFPFAFPGAERGAANVENEEEESPNSISGLGRFPLRSVTPRARWRGRGWMEEVARQRGAQQPARRQRQAGGGVAKRPPANSLEKMFPAKETRKGGGGGEGEGVQKPTAKTFVEARDKIAVD